MVLATIRRAIRPWPLLLGIIDEWRCTTPSFR